MPPHTPWFDAHLDLGCLAELGRDMHAPLAECRGRQLPAAVTLPALRDGHVTAMLATIFTQPIPDPTAPGAETANFAYPAGNADKAYVAGMRQLKLYQAWRDAGLLAPLPRRGAPSTPIALSTSPPTADPRSPIPSPPPIRTGILVEHADPISTPDELPLWVDGGVVAIGLAWSHASRYAAGNATPPDQDRGLTDLGKELVRRMDDLHVVHDASHLSDRALADLFAATDRPVIASHSNARALLGDNPAGTPQRHLADDHIREIARRGGVIGLNLYSPFLAARCKDTGRATLADALAHIEHICEVANSRRCIGLGSDMDGGFTADRNVQSVDCPAHLPRLAETLAHAGWPDDDIHAFAYRNWARFWNLADERPA